MGKGRSMEMGTLAWGEATRGRLSRAEVARLLGNLAFVRVREAWDALRAAAGLLRPAEMGVMDLAPPRTAFTLDALSHAEETHGPALLFHSWRTYYFGALIARHDGIAFDPELFFAAAILHDAGLTGENPAPLDACCFAVAGAGLARDHLLGCGHDRMRAEAVGDAIALHLNMHVSLRRHGPEAFLVARGAVCDLFGAGHRRLHPRDVAAVLADHPRDGVIEALRFETAEHMPGSRPGVMTGIFGRSAPPNPLDRPPAT